MALAGLTAGPIQQTRWTLYRQLTGYVLHLKNTQKGQWIVPISLAGGTDFMIEAIQTAYPDSKQKNPKLKRLHRPPKHSCFTMQ